MKVYFKNNAFIPSDVIMKSPGSGLKMPISGQRVYAGETIEVAYEYKDHLPSTAVILDGDDEAMEEVNPEVPDENEFKQFDEARKAAQATADLMNATIAEQAPVKRGRGRPRKES